MDSLFLDRDGVINVRIVDGYVSTPDEFVFEDGVLEAMAIFASKFSHIFVVTNQQGIGKGLMTDGQLSAVHDKMLREIAAAGGRVDRVYHCPELKAARSFMRKPSIGMALQARRDFPDVNLHQSVMVGDMATDMLFGRRAGMTTVLVGSFRNVARQNAHLVDFYYDNLLAYAQTL